MHFSLPKFWGGRTLCWGRGERGRGQAMQLAGWRWRQFPFSPVTYPDGKTPKGAIECHTWGHTFQCPNVSQLRPGLDATGGSSHSPGNLSFLSTFFFPSSKLGLSPPLLYTFAFFPSLSHVPPPFPSLSIQLASKRKLFWGAGAGGGLLSCLPLRCCGLKVETLLEIPRSSVSSNR